MTEGRRAYRGHAELRQYYADLAEFAEESYADWSEVYDLGDQVLVLGRLSMKFASGVELDQGHVSSRGGTASASKRVAM